MLTESQRKLLARLLRDVDDLHSQMSCDEYELDCSDFMDAARLIGEEEGHLEGTKLITSQGTLCAYFAELLERGAVAHV
jgi:hypothetical protein